MKLLSQVNEMKALRVEPYTAEEIENHEYSERIWATVAECKREAQEACRNAWSNGYWAGRHDRDLT